MASYVEAPSISANGFDGLKSPDEKTSDKNVRRRFGDACKALWPDEKVDLVIADLGDVDDRTARRWMRGSQMPPWHVIRAVLDRMFEPIED